MVVPDPLFVDDIFLERSACGQAEQNLSLIHDLTFFMSIPYGRGLWSALTWVLRVSVLPKLDESDFVDF